VHARRTALGWSLRALSERSGVSAGMLSDIERGAKSPTVRLAYQIAQALGCSITDLLGPADGPDGPVGGVAFASPRTLDDPETGVTRRSHPAPLLHGRLEVAEYRLAPGAWTGAMAPNRPGTVETVVVLEGALELVLDGTPHPVEAGASASHGVHVTEYRNPSRTKPIRFMVLIDTSRC
jgi:transcriptional regulator with XRE-family HTH domain